MRYGDPIVLELPLTYVYDFLNCPNVNRIISRSQIMYVADELDLYLERKFLFSVFHLKEWTLGFYFIHTEITSLDKLL